MLKLLFVVYLLCVLVISYLSLFLSLLFFPPLSLSLSFTPPLYLCLLLFICTYIYSFPPSQGPSSASTSTSHRKGGRQIDDFMNEMKKDKEDPVPQNSVPVPKVDKGGSFDDGDPTTTNLYIGNIAPCVTGRYYPYDNSEIKTYRRNPVLCI